MTKIMTNSGYILELEIGPEKALFKAVKYNDMEEIKRLLENGISIEAKDQWGNTALLYAAVRGSLQAVELLVKLGANIEAVDQDGMTALDIARYMALDMNVNEWYKDIVTILERHNNN